VSGKPGTLHSEPCKENMPEPNFIVLEFISTKNGKLRNNFSLDRFIVNNNTKTRFALIATINVPFDGHFNCSIYEPQFQDNKIKQLEGWYLHDGLKCEGGLVPIHNLNQIAKERPFIFFYKKM